MAERSGPCRVVVVGGGFAGLIAARTLGRAPVQAMLIDARDGSLTPSSRKILSRLTACFDDVALAVPGRCSLYGPPAAWNGYDLPGPGRDH